MNIKQSNEKIKDKEKIEMEARALKAAMAEKCRIDILKKKGRIK